MAVPESRSAVSRRSLRRRGASSPVKRTLTCTGERSWPGKAQINSAPDNWREICTFPGDMRTAHHEESNGPSAVQALERLARRRPGRDPRSARARAHRRARRRAGLAHRRGVGAGRRHLLPHRVGRAVDGRLHAARHATTALDQLRRGRRRQIALGAGAAAGASTACGTRAESEGTTMAAPRRGKRSSRTWRRRSSEIQIAVQELAEVARTWPSPASASGRTPARGCSEASCSACCSAVRRRD
jgi:hypothetical protein